MKASELKLIKSGDILTIPRGRYRVEAISTSWGEPEGQYGIIKLSHDSRGEWQCVFSIKDLAFLGAYAMRPPEPPTGLGAVVELRDGRIYIRTKDSGRYCWVGREGGGHTSNEWLASQDFVILSEGAVIPND